jgi:drug/metabolite transporter (DMT)-like permease
MRDKESASVAKPEARGLFLGGLGVLAFSMTLVATRAADPVFGALTVGGGRGVLASVPAALVLRRRGLPVIPRTDRRAIGLVAATVVIGFPLLTAIALSDVSAAHAAVVIGLVPAATAGFAVALAGERPARRYWAALSLGIIAVLAFAAAQGAGRPRAADGAALLAVILAGLGYAQAAYWRAATTAGW